jgi:hypothetical protein
MLEYVHTCQMLGSPSHGYVEGILRMSWTRGNIVVEALCYRPEGRGFDIWGSHWTVLFYLNITQPLKELSTRDRNKKLFRGVERGRCVRLETSPPAEIRPSRQCRILNISQPMGLHCLLQVHLYFLYAENVRTAQETHASTASYCNAFTFSYVDIRTTQETQLWASTVCYKESFTFYTCR